MKLYIAEKPAVAKAIVAALTTRGQPFKRVGLFYQADNGDCVAHARGHLLQWEQPHDHDVALKKWDMATLPFFFGIPKQVANPTAADILAELKQRIKGLAKTDEVIHCGDCDDEGQLIVDELLRHCNFAQTGQVKRIFINDNSEKSILQAIDNAQPNTEFLGLGRSAMARSLADYYYGLNLTRGYTLKSQQNGFEGVISVGRVQTPILGMIVRRDLSFAAHEKSFFYPIEATFANGQDLVTGQYLPHYEKKEGDNAEDNKHLTDEPLAANLARQFQGLAVKAVDVQDVVKKTSTKLPFNLVDLQADCYSKLDLNPDVVLSVTQSLRDNFNAITYNRSDCAYLRDEQFELAPGILKALAANTDADVQKLLYHADLSKKHKAFNTQKTGAHHGIIPTDSVVDVGRMSKNEAAVYRLIVLRYLGLFLPDYEYQEQTALVTVDLNGQAHHFKLSQKRTIEEGFKLFVKEPLDEPEAASLSPCFIDFNLFFQDKNTVKIHEANFSKKATKPHPLYTMATLLRDLPNAAKYVKNEQLRAVLIARDKEKAGENGGIGTSATRDSMIKILLDRGFIEIDTKKKLVSTELGKKVYAMLPDQAKFPDLTAIWQLQMTDIANNKLTVDEFLEGIKSYLAKEFQAIKSTAAAPTLAKFTCPDCQKALRRIKSDKGFFWGCSGFKEGCKRTFSDKGEKPVFEAKTSKPTTKKTVTTVAKK
jgi:DNA topoisomerase-3